MCTLLVVEHSLVLHFPYCQRDRRLQNRLLNDRYASTKGDCDQNSDRAVTSPTTRERKKQKMTSLL